MRNIELDGKLYVPIFSSLHRLREFIKDDVNYIAMNCMDFFNLVKGSDVILNPGSEYGKQFTVQEIEAILDGTLGSPRTRMDTEHDTQVMIGAPANPPTELLKTLGDLFRTMKNVKLAYNAHFFNPETDEKAHTLIAVQVTGDWEKTLDAVGIAVRGINSPDPPVDFIQLDGKSGLDNYFKNQKPFYRKKTIF